MKWAQKNKSAILWALTIIVIILIIIFSKPGDNAQEEANTNTNNETSQEDVSGTEADPAPVATEEGTTYDFSGIQWEFDTEDPTVPEGQTWLKMRFADFTRNGSVITFNNPYKLGFHPGTCQEVDFIDTTAETGIPLSYVQCTDGEVTRDIAVFQENEAVMVKYSDTGAEVETEGFQELYTLDITDLGLTPPPLETDTEVDASADMETEVESSEEMEG